MYILTLILPYFILPERSPERDVRREERREREKREREERRERERREREKSTGSPGCQPGTHVAVASFASLTTVVSSKLAKRFQLINSPCGLAHL